MVRVYLYILLVLGGIFSKPPSSIVAIILLLLNLYVEVRPPSRRILPPLTLSTIILLPMTCTFMPVFASGLMVIPLIWLLAKNLEDSPIQILDWEPGGRLTKMGKILIRSSLISLCLSSLLRQIYLLIGSLIASAFLISTAIYLLNHLPSPSLESNLPLLRVLMGERGEVTCEVSSRAGVEVRAELMALEEGFYIKPRRFMILPGSAVELEVGVKPIHSGPERLKVRAAVSDKLGLTLKVFDLDILELHVIPRARYAEWLAKRYLEGSIRSGGFTPITLPGLRPSRGGVEFEGCRFYHPGDSPRRIEWKHTSKLQRLVVKEYGGGFRRPGVIVGNMTAKSREDADVRLFNLISSGYTLAREGAPIALALYKRGEVIDSTPPLTPEESMKRLLKYVDSIEIPEGLLEERTLSPIELDRLIRNIELLRKAGDGGRVLSLLDFQLRAFIEASRRHPAGKAIGEALRRAPPPALMVLVSDWSHDAEALAVKLREARRRGYEIVASYSGR